MNENEITMLHDEREQWFKFFRQTFPGMSTPDLNRCVERTMRTMLYCARTVSMTSLSKQQRLRELWTSLQEFVPQIWNVLKGT